MKGTPVYAPIAPQPCRSCTDHAVPGQAYCHKHASARERRKRETTSADYQRPSYRRARRALLATYGKQCWTCDRERDPSAHHIDGNSRNNRLTNLAVLCLRCHGQIERELDAGIDGPVTRRLNRVLDARNPKPTTETPE